MEEELLHYRWKAGKEGSPAALIFVQVSGWQGIRGPLNPLLCISTGILVSEWKQEKHIWSWWKAELPISAMPTVTIYMLQKEGSRRL